MRTGLIFGGLWLALATGQAAARDVTITRDAWGIAHVAGRTDADAVFGAIYAQAEDDFPRIERNYLVALGRTAEADGEEAIWRDLRQRLFVDEAALRAAYAGSPAWLKALMDAWADGLNHYLATHPGVRPKVLTRFEPWMALSFTEGSIGGDIERISEGRLGSFYGGTPVPPTAEELGLVPREPSGSNGIAIAPALTANGNALLLINPHTSFYFRSELQMTSGEGLNAYGASTWGQFFIYQGFNEKIGWMHTSSNADVVDEFAETVLRRGRRLLYRHGREERALTARPVTLRFRRSNGSMGERTITTYRTHHGPITAALGKTWIATAMMWKPVPALEQSWLRTKAGDLASYERVAERGANSSNNTIFAGGKGEVAFLMPQFVPVRDARFDYTRPVDGSDPAADWAGLHGLRNLPRVVTPKVGWVRNTNDWPWAAAGPEGPREADYPRYMDQVGGNARGLHADALLKGSGGWTPEKLMAAAYDSHLPAFEHLLPKLFEAHNALPPAERERNAGPIALLRTWDRRWALDSPATTLAVFWGEGLGRLATSGDPHGEAQRVVSAASPAEMLSALDTAVERLTRDFGSWSVPWGQVNRFQRLDGAIQTQFDDAKPSTPVPFTSAVWGSLASFGARAYPNTRRYYGTSGNSFVAVVEFGLRVRAWGVSAGGESGDPASPHFADQIGRYAAGELRPIYFYPDELEGHVERRYRP